MRSREARESDPLSQVMSYEAGVVWLPRQFGRETFTSCPFTERQGGSLDFPLHYSLPLTPYTGEVLATPGLVG